MFGKLIPIWHIDIWQVAIGRVWFDAICTYGKFTFGKFTFDISFFVFVSFVIHIRQHILPNVISAHVGRGI
jgi:hypothetical protein